MSDKAKRAVNFAANAIVIVILVVIAFITLNIILSRGQGYTSIFGKAYVAVQSDSMEGTNPDSFNKGDLIKIKVLKDEEKSKMNVGDVITFKCMINGEPDQLNTHRIIEVNQTSTGVTYITQGDKPASLGLDEQTELVYPSTIVGKFTGKKLSGWGKAVDFFHSNAGFFVCVVLPSLLIVAYFAVNLVMTVRAAKAEGAEDAQVDEKERMRQELLAELRAQGKINDEAEPQAPPAEQAPAEDAEQNETEKDVSDDQDDQKE